MPSFTEPLVWQVREIYDELVKSHPDVAPYLAVCTMNRLARPWEALRLPLLVTRHSDDTLISKTDMGLVGEILFGRMDSLKTSIHRPAIPCSTPTGCWKRPRPLPTCPATSPRKSRSSAKANGASAF